MILMELYLRTMLRAARKRKELSKFYAARAVEELKQGNKAVGNTFKQAALRSRTREGVNAQRIRKSLGRKYHKYINYKFPSIIDELAKQERWSKRTTRSAHKTHQFIRKHGHKIGTFAKYALPAAGTILAYHRGVRDLRGLGRLAGHFYNPVIPKKYAKVASFAKKTINTAHKVSRFARRNKKALALGAAGVGGMMLMRRKYK